MRYVRAQDIFPEDLLRQIQDYVDGEYIYIPRREERKCSWGEKSRGREELDIRNANIYTDYLRGCKVDELSAYYFLSKKSIHRIILEEKRKEKTVP